MHESDINSSVTDYVEIKLVDGTSKQVPVKKSPGGSRIDDSKRFSTDGRTQRANMRRSQIIDLVSQGYTPEQACKHIGIVMSTYYQYRSDLPSFRTQVDLARSRWRQANDIKKGNWEDFPSFRKRFFNLDTYEVHAQIIDAIENSKEMDVVLILVPPEFGKTTLLEDKISEILAKNPDARCAYISEGSKHSKKVGSRIKRRMTDRGSNKDYIDKYGPFYEDGQEKEGKPWTTEYFVVNKADHDERDYSFEARGARSNIQGSRVDWLFLDDIQSLKSLSQTDFLLTQFRQEWITRVGKMGKIFIIGNRIGHGDIYEKLIEEDLVTRLIEIPAMDEEGNSTCPELWPNEQLERRKNQVGPEVWARTYMQNPVAAGKVTFTDEVIDNAKAWNRVIAKREGLATIMSLDPGLGGGNSLTVCQYNHERMEIVDQECDYGLGRTEQILDKIAIMASKYRPQDFIVEMIAFQQALGKDERLIEMSKRYGFRIYPHVTHDNKWDPTFGVASMAGSMRAGELTIPWGDEEAQDRMDPLIREMQKWRPAVRGTKLKQDRVMSLWFAWLFWSQTKVMMSIEESKWRMKSLPWKATAR